MLSLFFFLLQSFNSSSDGLQSILCRSPTSPESLEQLLQNLVYVASRALLDAFDNKRVAGHKSPSTSSSILSNPEDLLAPGLLLISTSLDVR
jgi:hypothetical protein